MPLEKRDDRVSELLDADSLDDAAIDANLRDIRRINGVLGWKAFTVQRVGKIIQQLSLPSVKLLDVCAGSADMPLAIANWSRQQSIDTSIVATDIAPQIVRIAKQQAKDVHSIRVETANALDLPYADHSFDIVLCTLALHHFDPDKAAKLLQNMARVGKHLLVFDIERSTLAYLGAVLLTRVIPMNYMTRHDAPVSVRRAYTVREIQHIIQQAGLTHSVAVHADFPFRLVIETTHTVKEDAS